MTDHKYLFIAILRDNKYYIGLNNNKNILPSDIFNIAEDDWVIHNGPCLKIEVHLFNEDCYEVIDKLIEDHGEENVFVSSKIDSVTKNSDWNDV